MKSKQIIVPFIVSLFVLPAIFALAMHLAADPKMGKLLTNYLFVLTVLVEVVALFQVMVTRKLFSRHDPGHLTWSLVAAFLAVRLLAELRLSTLTFKIVEVPNPAESAPPGLFFYIFVLRYLYTLSDLIFIAALVATIRAYKSTGLNFRLLKQDYLYFPLVWAIPIATWLFRANLGINAAYSSDKYLPTYRLVAVFVGALIVSLSLVVRRYTSQMGGGAIARVWNTVAMAGLFRAASFLALALLSRRWPNLAVFTDQYLLWIFSCCWLLAALYQREVISGSVEPLSIASAAPEAAN
jgi:hypothetical protein